MLFFIQYSFYSSIAEPRTLRIPQRLLYLSVESSWELLEAFVNNLGVRGPIFLNYFEVIMAKVQISGGF
jgi:hypothetical protein